MPGGGTPGADLQRSINALTIGRARAAGELQAQSSLEGLQEWEDQFKVDVGGRAEEFPVWGITEIKFNVDFIDATGQRDLPFDRPHFTYGCYVEEGGPVGLLACVTAWKLGEDKSTIGCTLAVGAVATDFATTFRGEIHARFQGYGAPTDLYGSASENDIG